MNPAQEFFSVVCREVDKVVFGKSQAKAIIFSTFLARGNILLEGVPGVAKTLLARAFAKTMGLKFSRIQFTPDLMPTDIIGTSVYNQGKAGFEFIPGPLFSDFILADEINRAPAKTQAALLEAMEERQVSVDNTTYAMSQNFIVFATQNPLEFEGTYALPEAQLDRFMVRLILDYPSPEEETQILAAPPLFSGNAIDRVETLSFPAQALQMVRQHLAQIVIDDKIIQYVRDIIRMSRSLDQLILGNSPRAGQMLLSLARAFAAVNGYDFVTPDHIRELAPVVLPHRWIVKPEMEIQQTPVKTIIKNIFDSVKVPQ